MYDNLLAWHSKHRLRGVFSNSVLGPIIGLLFSRYLSFERSTNSTSNVPGDCWALVLTANTPSLVADSRSTQMRSCLTSFVPLYYIAVDTVVDWHQIWYKPDVVSNDHDGVNSNQHYMQICTCDSRTEMSGKFRERSAKNWDGQTSKQKTQVTACANYKKNYHPALRILEDSNFRRLSLNIHSILRYTDLLH